jgi:diaminopimelate decarboxylase
LAPQWKSSEFLPDPTLSPEEEPIAPARSCVGGASCLEEDMLTWRKVVFPREPSHGDLLNYSNTAGYVMDTFESEFHC